MYLYVWIRLKRVNNYITIIKYPYNEYLQTISNGNRTEWSTIQGVIGQVISNHDLKLLARLPLNCMTRSPITN